MGQWSFIKNIIKDAKKTQKKVKSRSIPIEKLGPQKTPPKDNVYNNFRNHLAKEIAEEKSYRKDIGKNPEKYNKPYTHKTGEVSFNAKEAGKASRDYIKASLNNLQNYKKGKLMQIQKERFDKEFSN